MAGDHPRDDRTTKARIRDAAVGCFAEYGAAGTTTRRVATRAGVSPGLVIHHFGTMDGLRAACDEHVAAAIRALKRDAMSAGPELDLLGVLRSTNVGPLTAYLSRILAEDSPAAAELVDSLIADAEGYLEQGVATGMIRPAADPRGRAVVLTLWNLGALVLHKHLQRIIGVDLTEPGVGANQDIGSFIGPVYEIYGEGILTEAFAGRARAALAGLAGQGRHQEQTPLHQATSSPTAPSEGTE